jgi:hypothetical protein
MDLQSNKSMKTVSAPVMKGLSAEMQMCIENCLRCHQVCEQMIQHCLRKGGRHAEASHIRLMQDCAAICALSADFMLRGSDLHSQTCGVCATICQACAESCRLMNDDEMMQMCVDACEACYDSCSKMASQH